MSKLFIHNYPWLAGNQDLLDSLETAILAHGAEVLADCIKLHAFLVAEGGKADYGDCDSTFQILNDQQLAGINSSYCHPKITHAMWHRNHCGDLSHLFAWADNGEEVDNKSATFLLEHPSDSRTYDYLRKSRKAVFHIREWNSVGEDGRSKDFKKMMRYGDGRDEDFYFTMVYDGWEFKWEVELIPNFDTRDPHFYIQNALCQHEQDEED